MFAPSNEPPRAVGNLVPGAREVTQWLGDDEAGVVTQFIQDLQIRVQLPHLGYVGGVVQRARGFSLE